MNQEKKARRKVVLHCPSAASEVTRAALVAEILVDESAVVDAVVVRVSVVSSLRVVVGLVVVVVVCHRGCSGCQIVSTIKSRLYSRSRSESRKSR